MRAEKKLIGSEYLSRLNGSPFFIVVDYQGLKVDHFSELRRRLRGAQAEVHVVKNSIFRIAAREAGIAEFGEPLAGQIAVVTGQKDISAAAKVVKNFHAEFEKPKIRFGFLDNERLAADAVMELADLPSLEVLRGRLLGVIQAPASKLAQIIGTPGTQLARVIKARVDKEQGGAA